MNPQRHARISEVFLAAVEVPVADRMRFLDTACISDPELRREVESLLLRDRDRARIDTPALATPLPDILQFSRPPAANIPNRIGSYEVLELLGQGGMGIVYKARQQHPNRIVALKVLGGSAVSPGLLKRFEFEALVLGRLQHPGIAQIFESGVAEDGPRRIPYFAMELVDGIPLTEYCRRHKVSRRGRLELIRQVCEAVQSAHEKGVVHRDLKPGNILVDHHARPRILDFGVARAMDDDLRNTTLMTTSGQLVGTLPYMSPEQLDGRIEAIDTRSDVYALGVLTYELLADRLPHEISGRPLPDAIRILRNADPPALATVDRSLRGDLETIVAKAMEKEPACRYASASELAADIVRFLNDQPILARPPTVRYQLRKFARRNRLLVGGASLFLVLMVAATAVSAWLAVREARQRQLAERVVQYQSRMLRGIDVAAMGRGLKSDYRAQIERGLARTPIPEGLGFRDRTPVEIAASLASFDELSDPATQADVARQLLDKFVLQRAAHEIEQQFADDPLVRAQLHAALGVTYQELGLYDSAEQNLRIALTQREAQLPPGHLDIADSQDKLGQLFQAKEESSLAAELLRQALVIRRARLRKDDPRIGKTLSNLAAALTNLREFDEAQSLLEESLAILRKSSGSDDEAVAGALTNLGELLRAKGDLTGSESAHRSALEIYRRDEASLDPYRLPRTLNNLANVLTEAGRFAEAEPLQRESLERYRQAAGAEHPETMIALHNLANTLRCLDRFEAAEPLFRQVLDISQRVYPDDPQRSHSLAGLAIVLQARGEFAEAERLNFLTRSLIERRLGTHHPDYAAITNNLAAMKHARREYDAAEPLYREALEIRRATLPAEHPAIAESLSNLAALLRDKGEPAAAEALYREALPIWRRIGAKHDALAVSLAGLARVCSAQGKFAEAEPLFSESLQILRSTMPPNAPQLLLTEVRFGRNQVQLGRYEEAENLIRGAQATAGDQPDAPVSRAIAEGFAELYEAWNMQVPDDSRAAEAAKWRQKLAAGGNPP